MNTARLIVRFDLFLLMYVVLLQAILGEYFYKTDLFGIYISELAILFCIALMTCLYLSRLRLPRHTWFFCLALLSLYYIVHSFMLGRELYWIARQSAFLLYGFLAYLSYIAVSRGYLGSSELRRILRFCGFGGALLVVGHGLGYLNFVPVVRGGTQLTALLILMVGFGYWLTTCKSVLHQVIVSACTVGAVTVLSPHSTFPISLFCMFCLNMLIGRRRLLLPFFVVAPIIGLFATWHSEGLLDNNATWRYLYWVSIVVASWQRGWFLIGNGFGAPFLPESSDYFGRLLSQVSGSDNAQYQLMTVPPHNSILTILSYLGVFGVVLLLWPYFNALRKEHLQRYCDRTQRALVLALTGHFLLLCANQFLEVPYAAMPFWLLYGALMGYLRSDRSHVMDTEETNVRPAVT